MQIVQTERLTLRWLNTEDAPFILDLVNDPDWLRFIGDRGVRTLEDARAYIVDGPVAMYARLGFGLYMVELRDSRAPVGICGLLKRAALDDVDLGFALLPQFRGKGYVLEAAAGVLEHARRDLHLDRVVAIVSPHNHASIRVLSKLGFGYQGRILLPDQAEEVCVYATSTGWAAGSARGPERR